MANSSGSIDGAQRGAAPSIDSAGRELLVLDGDVGSSLAIVQSLGRAGYRVTAAAPEATPHPKALRSRLAAQRLYYPDPTLDLDAFQQWMGRQGGFDLVIPVTDRTLLPLHEIRDLAALAGRLALPPPAAVRRGFDKETVRALAASLGIVSPDSVLLADRAELDRLSDPRIDAWRAIDEWLRENAVVVKSTRSKIWRDGSVRAHAVRMVHDRPALEAAAQAMLVDGPVQLQRWVPGHGLGIEMLVDHGQVVLHFAHERLHELPLTGGGSSYRRSVQPPAELLAAAARLVGALSWHGVAMAEFRTDPASGSTYLMELNGRFWGSLPLSIAAGVDFPVALVRLLLDGTRPVQPPFRRVYARQVERDLRWTLQVARLRYRDLVHRGPPQRGRRLLLDRSLILSLAQWGRLLGGRETWDGAALDDPQPLLSELGDLAGRTLKAFAGRATARRAEVAARAAWQAQLPPTRRILMVCSGNIYRSAYAAARLALSDLGHNLQIRSAGIAGPAGRETPPAFLALARARGVDLEGHRSRLLSDDDLSWAGLVLVMEEKHEATLSGRIEPARLRWLGAILNGGDGGPAVPDPVDMDAKSVQRVLDQLDRAVEALLARLPVPVAVREKSA